MANMKETWKTVYLKDYKHYEVSNQGKVRNKKTQKLLKPSSHATKYLCVDLYNKCNRQRMRIHRLVYNSFYPAENFENFHVHHRNGNRQDNTLPNLQKLSPQEHYNLEYKKGTVKIGRLGSKNLLFKGKIGQFDRKGILLNVFIGKTDLRYSHFTPTAVYAVINGKAKTYKGFYWKRFPKKFKPEIGQKYDLNDVMFEQMVCKKVFKKKPKNKQLCFDFHNS